MSVELYNASGPVGQFASNGGYSDLIAAAEAVPVLKAFFEKACAEDTGIKPIVTALESLDGDADVKSSARTLAGFMHGQGLVFISNGTHDGVEKSNGDDENAEDDHESAEDRSSEEDAYKEFDIPGTICKLDESKHLVFGWFSIVSIGGKHIVDSQNDILPSIEDAAYSFVLNARIAGQEHTAGADGKIEGIGRLVESVVFTEEKQAAMLKSLHDQGVSAACLSLGVNGWWGGFKIDDESVWQDIVNNRLKAFSIGGKGRRASL